VKRLKLVMALNKLSIDKLDLKDKRVLIRYVCEQLTPVGRCTLHWLLPSKTTIIPFRSYDVHSQSTACFTLLCFDVHLVPF